MIQAESCTPWLCPEGEFPARRSTSCLLISLVEKVLFWWTSRLSDHRVLFLRLVGVGPAPLLLALRDIPGDLLDMD